MKYQKHKKAIEWETNYLHIGLGISMVIVAFILLIVLVFWHYIKMDCYGILIVIGLMLLVLKGGDLIFLGRGYKKKK